LFPDAPIAAAAHAAASHHQASLLLSFFAPIQWYHAIRTASVVDCRDTPLHCQRFSRPSPPAVAYRVFRSPVFD